MIIRRDLCTTWQPKGLDKLVVVVLVAWAACGWPAPAWAADATASPMLLLAVETADGRRFQIVAGFSDAQRRSPPPLGSIVSYRYRDLPPRGIPRFASFMRQHEAG